MSDKINSKWTNFARLSLNLAIFFMVLVLSGLLLKNHLLSNSNDSTGKRITEGENISLSEIEWKQNTQTLFLFLYSQCAYCLKSRDFYRRLAEKTYGKDSVRLIAVFPNQDETSEEFLKESSLSSVENKKIDFSAVGVFDTPTIILTDDKGVVRRVWKGQVSALEESAIFDILGLEADENTASQYIHREDLNNFISKEPTSIVDLREREIYKQEHLSKAVNIPFDELSVRAINELEQSYTIVLYGDLSDKKKMESSVKILNAQGFEKALILDERASRTEDAGITR